MTKKTLSEIANKAFKNKESGFKYKGDAYTRAISSTGVVYYKRKSTRKEQMRKSSRRAYEDLRSNMMRGAKRNVRRSTKRSVRRSAKRNVRRSANRNVRRSAKRNVRRSANRNVRRSAKRNVRRSANRNVRRSANRNVRNKSKRKSKRKMKYKRTPLLYVDGKGSPTRGWAADAPQQGKPRELLKKKCGKECFLIPSRNEFPICSKKNNCKVDCRGVLAAKIRASQWSGKRGSLRVGKRNANAYKRVARSAEKIGKDKGCYWAKSSSKRRNKRRSVKRSVKRSVRRSKRRSKRRSVKRSVKRSVRRSKRRSKRRSVKRSKRRSTRKGQMRKSSRRVYKGLRKSRKLKYRTMSSKHKNPSLYDIEMKEIRQPYQPKTQRELLIEHNKQVEELNPGMPEWGTDKYTDYQDNRAYVDRYNKWAEDLKK